MADPRALLDAYAKKETILLAVGDPNFEGHWTPYEDVTPKAFAALRAVLDLHPPFTLADSTHDPKPVGCDHCSEVPNFVDWPCPTVQAVITALEADHG